MAESDPIPNKNRILPSGVELTRITRQRFDIVSGESHPFVPKSLQFDPGTKQEKELLSGEAIIFPKQPVTLMLGRHTNVDIIIDPDFVAKSEDGDFATGDPEYSRLVQELSGALQTSGLGKLDFVVDIGDTGISRHAAQISRHPDGATVVSYESSMGRKHYQKEHLSYLSQSLLNGPVVLRNHKEKPLVHKLVPMTYQGAQILHNGDVLVFRGDKRTICLRYFEESDANGLQFKPAMMIKQSYPKDINIEELHKTIIKEAQTEI